MTYVICSMIHVHHIYFVYYIFFSRDAVTTFHRRRRSSSNLASHLLCTYIRLHFRSKMAVPDLPVAETAQAEAPAVDAESGMEEAYSRKHEAMKRFRQESIVVVSNVPKIEQDMYSRLVTKLTPIFENAGPLRPGTTVSFPQGADGSSLGCVLVEYLNPDAAFKAKNILDGKKLDHRHTFWARISTDFNAIHNFPKEYVPPAALPIHNKDQPNYKSWLLDNRGRDMFMIRHNELTSVYWNDHIIKPSLVS